MDPLSGVPPSESKKPAARSCARSELGPPVEVGAGRVATGGAVYGAGDEVLTLMRGPCCAFARISARRFEFMIEMSD